MSMIISGILLSVLSNALYDIAKHIYSFADRKTTIDKDKIKEHILQNVDRDLLILLDSSSFCSYLQSPQVFDMLYSYFTYRVTGKVNHSIRNLKKDDEQILEDDITNFLSRSFFSTYLHEDVISGITFSDVEKFFKQFLLLSIEYLLKSLDSNTFAAVFLVNNFIAISNEKISNSLSDILEMLKKQTAFAIELKDYSNIKEKYLYILKSNFSSAHIYLLDDFEFNSFYVAPSLQMYRDSIKTIQMKIDTQWIKLADNNDTIDNKFIDSEIVEINTIVKGSVSYTADLDELHSYHSILHGYTDWESIFDKSNFVYIIGGAGYGKSLFLRNIINNYSDLNITRPEEYIVIYGELKHFYNESSTAPLSMIKFLHTSMLKYTLLDQEELSQEFLQYYINQGRCIILLDALDEVDKSKRSELHKTIIAFIKSMNPNNKICITSRTRGFMPLEGLLAYEISALDSKQIVQYVNNIVKLGKFQEKYVTSFLNQATALVDKGFLTSFLVLSLLINIYKGEKKLPENKLALYDKCFDYIAKIREVEKSDGKFGWDMFGCIMKENTFILLANLCFPNNTEIRRDDVKTVLLRTYKGKYPSEWDAEYAIDLFLTFCAERTELFVPASEDHFRFFHRSFFEFYYARFIFLYCSNAKQMYLKLLKFDIDSEIFELLIAILKESHEQKYKNLAIEMFAGIDKSFRSKRPSFLPINIMGLCIQTIDDASYRKLFVEYLVKYRDIIIKYNQKLLVNSQISDFLKTNEMFCAKTNDAYQQYSLVFISAIIMSNKREISRFKNALQNGDRKYCDGAWLFYTLHNINNNFYTTIFCQTANIKVIINNLSESEINLLDELSNKISVKQKVKALVDFFRSLESREQDKFVHILNSLNPRRLLTDPTYMNELTQIINE